MWAPFYEVVLCNAPMLIPIQQTTLYPISFPMVQPVSTIPNPMSLQHNKIQPELNDGSLDSLSDDSKLKEQPVDMEGLPDNTFEELLEIMKLVIAKNDREAKYLEDEIFEKFPLAKTVGKQFFANLICKLKKLTKTKEEIIKYCMRKAFKFVNERLKQDSHQLPEDDILKEFLKGMCQGNSQNIPFKKHSHFKTMNTHFLSQLFSSPKFVELYHEFLQVFPAICEADNEKKIDNLAKTMFKHITSSSKDMKRFNNFKRIPWTQSILNRCFLIAKDLQKYASTVSKRGSAFTDQ